MNSMTGTAVTIGARYSSTDSAAVSCLPSGKQRDRRTSAMILLTYARITVSRKSSPWSLAGWWVCVGGVLT